MFEVVFKDVNVYKINSDLVSKLINKCQVIYRNNYGKDDGSFEAAGKFYIKGFSKNQAKLFDIIQISKFGREAFLVELPNGRQIALKLPNRKALKDFREKTQKFRKRNNMNIEMTTSQAASNDENSCDIDDNSLALSSVAADQSSSSSSSLSSSTSLSSSLLSSSSQQSLSTLESGKTSKFDIRTDPNCAKQYFQSYSLLSQHQNILQDFSRTTTYVNAINSNVSDFEGKIILDVGSGSGFLSLFAAKAGASKVYAVEASDMAVHSRKVVKQNKLEHIVTVIKSKIEDICLPELVDVIISEPMGYMMINERMLESFVYARKWLKPNGKMYPSRGDLHIAPFNDEGLYLEQVNKSNFWCQPVFHGVDLNSVRPDAYNEYIRLPVIDTFDITSCLSKSQRYSIDFYHTNETDLHRIDIPLEFHVLQTNTCHGLAFWFDIEFAGSSKTVWLSTAPTEPLTHWYQVRSLLRTPIYIKQGQCLTGNLTLLANKFQSYDISFKLHIEGTEIESHGYADLKNPYFRHSTDSSGMYVSYNNSVMDSGGGSRNLIDINTTDNAGIAENDSENSSAQSSSLNIHPGCILSTGYDNNVNFTLYPHHKSSENLFNNTTTSSIDSLISSASSNTIQTQQQLQLRITGSTSSNLSAPSQPVIYDTNLYETSHNNIIHFPSDVNATTCINALGGSSDCGSNGGGVVGGGVVGIGDADVVGGGTGAPIINNNINIEQFKTLTNYSSQQASTVLNNFHSTCVAAPTSTQNVAQHQLIGGATSPALFTLQPLQVAAVPVPSTSIVLHDQNSTSIMQPSIILPQQNSYPYNGSLMIGDFAVAAPHLNTGENITSTVGNPLPNNRPHTIVTETSSVGAVDLFGSCSNINPFEMVISRTVFP